MSKRRRRVRRLACPADRSSTLDVVSQLLCALRHPHAAILGAVLGGVIPWFGRTLAHGEFLDQWSAGRTALVGLLAVVIFGCAAFSAISVYRFGRAAFGDRGKAIGFMLALEGVMLASTGATSNAALGVLIAINAIANGSVIALARDATERRADADRRRSATRAQNRERARSAAPVMPAPMPASEPSKPVRPRRPSAPGLAHAPRLWDVDDAEIVSETIYS